MPSSYHEIPVLPVVVALAAVAFAVLLWRLHRRAAMTVPRVVVSAAMCVYGAGVIGNTLLPIYVGTSGHDQPWRVYLNLTPLVGTEPMDMLQNVVVFVPLGFLLPLIAGVTSLPRVLLWGFLVSLTMEALQFVNAVTAHGGHVADVNDLLANTLGAPLGYGIFRVALLLPALGRWAGTATWPMPPQGEPEIQPARISL
jgi:glycopeptide antibiotics resistance protein